MKENLNPIDFYDEILEVFKNNNLAVSDKYPKYRRLLDTVCKDLTKNDRKTS